MTSIGSRPDISTMSIGQVLNLVDQCVSSTDQQIRSIAERMRERADGAGRCSERIQQLHRMANAANRNSDGSGLIVDARYRDDADTRTLERDDLRAVDEILGERPTAPPEAGAEYDEFRARLITAAGDDFVLEQADIDDLIAAEKEELNQINSGNELEMMDLQALTSQRGQHLGAGSQLLAASREANMQVIGNLR